MQHESQLFSIGEFSQISGLSIKTLRFYDEKDLLKPARVDPATNYRFYDAASAERARMISRLRELQFPLDEIARILRECGDESDLLDALRKRERSIAECLRADGRTLKALRHIISRETEAAQMAAAGRFAIEEKSLEPLVMAGLRVKGRYQECGRAFSQVARAMGRHLSGRPFCLYYDGEYREEDASFEACFPLHQKVPSSASVEVRVLPEERCLSLIHQGPYEQLGRSYQKLLVEVKRRGLAILLPTREVYLKGPGMIFKGNPMRYLTEIQIPVQSA